MHKFILLQFVFIIYSMAGVFNKCASEYDFLSLEWIMFFCLLLSSLVIYGIGWQQILKYYPLTTAAINKSVAVVWGMIWSWMIFNETFSFIECISICFVIVGIVIFSYSKE